VSTQPLCGSSVFPVKQTQDIVMPNNSLQPNSIESILKRGTEGGVEALAPLERKVWLISEAEVLCDMEGIDSFLDRYITLLPETVIAFAEVGATEIAESLQAIHDELPTRRAGLLNHANALVSARSGYDHDAVARLVKA
jgi:hypothetical protein